MELKVTAKYEPDEDDQDNDDPCGLTADAFENITGELMQLGFTDIEFAKS